MLARLNRFHGYNTLTALYRRSETVRGQQISLKYSVRGDKPFRVAVVVSKKVSKSAVVRNRIRRRIYEQVQSRRAVIPKGGDLLFTVFSDEFARAEPAVVAQAIEQLLQKAFSCEHSTR